MTDEKIKTAIELWSQINKVYEKFRKAQVKTIFDAELTVPQYGVLEVLLNEGPMTLKKIGEKLFVSGANITCVIDNLEKEGFVKRVPSNVDRRMILAELTEDGKNKIENLYPLNAKNIYEMASLLNDNEQTELQNLLARFD